MLSWSIWIHQKSACRYLYPMREKYNLDNSSGLLIDDTNTDGDVSGVETDLADIGVGIDDVIDTGDVIDVAENNNVVNEDVVMEAEGIEANDTSDVIMESRDVGIRNESSSPSALPNTTSSGMSSSQRCFSSPGKNIDTPASVFHEKKDVATLFYHRVNQFLEYGQCGEQGWRQERAREGYSPPPSKRNDQFVGAHFKTILPSSNLLSIKNHVLIKIVIATQC